MANDIPQGWRKCKLGDVAEIIREVIDPQKTPNEIFTLYSIPAFDNQKIPEFLNGYEIQSSKYHIVEKCILISKLNPGVSRVWKIIDPSPDKISSTEFIPLKIKENEGDVAFDYTYYLLKNPIFYKLFEEWANGTSGSHQRIKPNQVLELDILLPPLPEQKAIASVLGSLDDKIDLLRKENQTLEQLAETLFRQWFIEEADDSWERRSLDKIAYFLNGLACQKYPPKNENIKLPVLKIRELKSEVTEDSDFAAADVPEEFIVKNGDVIFSWSGSLLVKIWDGNKCILNQHLFKVTSEFYPKWFYYFWIKHHINKFISIAEGKATTMGHIKREDISNSMVLIPSVNELENMDKIISPFIEKIILNNQQILEVENLRDTLLPKLMSGEVRLEYE